MESFDLNIDNLEPISLDFDSGKSMNFGNGAELLMNMKKSTPQSSTIDLGDLDTLESELNDLSSSSSSSSSSKPAGDTKVLSGLSNFFGFGSKEEEPVKVGLGQATKDSGSGNTKTWDGYGKFTDIPSGSEKPINSKMSERDKLRKKKMMMKRLEEWRAKGLVSGAHFNNDSS